MASDGVAIRTLRIACPAMAHPSGVGAIALALTFEVDVHVIGGVERRTSFSFVLALSFAFGAKVVAAIVAATASRCASLWAIARRSGIVLSDKSPDASDWLLS